MPFYHTLGQIPPKRHTQFEKPPGRDDAAGLYYEQLFGTIGFEGMSVLESVEKTPVVAVEKNILSRKLLGFNLEPTNADFIESRIPLLVNKEVIVGLAAPTRSMTDSFYKNADADELIFVHRGSGRLRTLLGTIPFEYGDYLIIPRGMIYQIEFDSDTQPRLLYLESHSPIYTPKRYRNQFGQLLEHSPFCERDINRPQNLETHDETGNFLIKIKKQGALHSLVYATHPFDVVGWDGYNYPYGFSIFNFEPIFTTVEKNL